MNPVDYTLQHSNIPQPKLLDEEIATTNWPMPPAKPWSPLPAPNLLQRIAEVLS